MATRSTISIKQINAFGNEQYKTIYCHWDGYPSNNGAILLEHYTTADKVNELISLGDISSLRENPKPSETQEHSFDKPIDNVVIAYHRDRGAELSINTAYSKKGIKGQEYDYLFEDGVWKVRSTNKGNFVVLTRKRCELDEK